MFMDWIDRPSIVRSAVLPKLIHRFSLSQKSWLDVFFGGCRLTKLNFIWKTKGIRIALVQQGRPSAAKTKLKNRRSPKETSYLH